MLRAVARTATGATAATPPSTGIPLVVQVCDSAKGSHAYGGSLCSPVVQQLLLGCFSRVAGRQCRLPSTANHSQVKASSGKQQFHLRWPRDLRLMAAAVSAAVAAAANALQAGLWTFQCLVWQPLLQ